MNPQQLNIFKEYLLKQLSEVSETINQQRSTTQSLSAKKEGDFADHSDTGETQILEQLVESEGHLIEKIQLALTRIELGTYGKCSNCNKEINLERLKAKPSVSLCLRCQEKKERD